MNVVRIYTAPLQFPCGPGTTCCSVGQSDEYIGQLTSAIENMGVVVKVHYIEKDNDLGSRFPNAGVLLKEFGPGITPILSLNDEVIAMGVPTPEDALTLLREKLNKP